MKAYGRKRQDFGCCPGHDKYPADTYTRKPCVASRRNMDRGRKKRARQAGVRAVIAALEAF